MMDREYEEILTGGNVSTVYRVGDTVRRELKPESDNIHKLLKHLEKKGFRYAPRFLGIDDKEREILSFLEGESGAETKMYMWSDDALKQIAKMLRSYHDAVSDFSFEDSWQPIDNTPPKQHEVLCHNDFAMYNIIFNKEKPVGIIDFDVAGPGPRLWDIAYTIYTCVPLSRLYFSETNKVTYNSTLHHAEKMNRKINLFFSSYGQVMKEDFLDIVILRLEGLCKTITRKANEGDSAFQKMIVEGHLNHYQKDIEFIREHGNEWI
ncbi:trifolitoxin immunity domain protein [Gracilibacillus boraciitolerans JCM 21714]|uniref:Trifolitoxin immunity domain protein n=1 Tax=Gracilibacillus boraciitolerans JCM 21714 TaxID=1298598 RepID=W4VKF9_9BACI|nr:phosphotransferase [Gracilibacillus boraciitolerans]GAE93636.1 trifolitoxin immunity domain protein [Gracilibacillus boraciitolerans JCM 21714]